MKEIAQFYRNRDHLTDGTTEYFLAVKDYTNIIGNILSLLCSMGLCPKIFIDHEQGRLQMEISTYSKADQDELIGKFYTNEHRVFYEHI